MPHKLESIDFVCSALRSVDLVVPDLGKAVAFYTASGASSWSSASMAQSTYAVPELIPI